MESEVLSRIPLFADLPATEQRELVKLLQPCDFAAGEHIVWVGEPGKEFFIIQQGTVMICLPDDAGRELRLATLQPGQFFGEISLLDGGPRTATARADTPARLLKLGREDFYQFVSHYPSAAIHMLKVLGGRQRETNDKLRGIKNANEVIQEKSTRGQRIAEGIAGLFASSPFVTGNLIFFTAWIVLNVVLSAKRRFDEPPTFFTLGFMITLEAILLSMFVLNSQKRSAERDRIRADLEYQVNLKNHLEVMQLHQKVDRLEKVLAVSSGATLDASGEPGVARIPGGSGGIVP